MSASSASRRKKDEAAGKVAAAGEEDFLVHRKGEKRIAGGFKLFNTGGFPVLGFLVLVALTLMSTSYLLTESLTFNYQVPSWIKLKKLFLPAPTRILTLEELAEHGPDAETVYISILGHVFDVTPGRATYGSGGTYSCFAGRDSSRSFVTGCFKEPYLTHDIRGLGEQDVRGIKEWVDFYKNSDKYDYIGTVQLPSVEGLPLPDDCDQWKKLKQSSNGNSN